MDTTQVFNASELDDETLETMLTLWGISVIKIGRESNADDRCWCVVQQHNHLKLFFVSKYLSHWNDFVFARSKREALVAAVEHYLWVSKMGTQEDDIIQT